MFITRETERHYLVSKIVDQKDFTSMKLIEDMYVNNYMVNVKSYSSIRYFINNIISLCEWLHYHPMDNKEGTGKRESVSSNKSNERTKKKGNIIENFFGKTGAQSDGNDKIEEEDKAEYAYPDLNNRFYQRFCLMESLYSVLEKKQEDPEEKNEENEHQNEIQTQDDTLINNSAFADII